MKQWLCIIILFKLMTKGVDHIILKLERYFMDGPLKGEYNYQQHTLSVTVVN